MQISIRPILFFALLAWGCSAAPTTENEQEPLDAPESTLPRIAVDLDCMPGESHRNTLCDWVLGAEVMVYGVLEELVVVEWEDGPGEPVQDCSSFVPSNLRMTIAVEEALHGTLGDRVEIYIPSSVASSWFPVPTCTADNRPDEVHWETWDDPRRGLEEGEGPLQVGQNVGIAASLHEEGYFYSQDETNSLFVEREGSLALQTGAALYCDVLRVSQELEDLLQGSFEDFIDAARACSAAGPVQCPNTLLDSDASCPVGCHDFPNRIEAYRLDEDCRIEDPTFCLKVHQSLVEGDDAIGCWVHTEDQFVVLTSIYLTPFTTEIEGWSPCDDWDGWDDEAQMNRFWHENTDIEDCLP